MKESGLAIVNLINVQWDHHRTDQACLSVAWPGPGRQGGSLMTGEARQVCVAVVLFYYCKYWNVQPLTVLISLPLITVFQDSIPSEAQRYQWRMHNIATRCWVMSPKYVQVKLSYLRLYCSHTEWSVSNPKHVLYSSSDSHPSFHRLPSITTLSHRKWVSEWVSEWPVKSKHVECASLRPWREGNWSRAGRRCSFEWGG